jgi:hypothetical protein
MDPYSRKNDKSPAAKQNAVSRRIAVEKLKRE